MIKRMTEILKGLLGHVKAWGEWKEDE